MTVPTFNELAQEIHRNAIDHGWWAEEEVEVGGAGIGVGIPRNFGEVLMLIVTEASEAMDSWRDGDDMTTVYMKHRDGTRCESHKRCLHPAGTSDEAEPEGIPIELADVIIRTLDACAAYGIDIDTAISTKMQYNSTRPYKHGRAR